MSADSISVSVIVPVYNGQATIEACLESLLRLAYPRDHLELIVVDNGSTDATSVVLSRYRGRARILYAERRGPAAARNEGIRNASGDWIAFTDADCTVEPDWLTHLLSPLVDPAVGVVGGKILSVEPCNRIERFGEQIHDHRRAIEEFRPPYAITMNWASRRHVLEAVGLFDETLPRGQDVDLARRIQRAGYRLVYSSRAKIRHLNERTFWGLFREGFQHARGSRAVRAKHPELLSERRQRLSIARRVGHHAMRCVRGGRRFDALCALVFDLGKLAGDRTASRRQARPCLT